MDSRRCLAAAVLCASVLAGPGCSGGAAAVAGNGPQPPLTQTCMRLLQDMRLYCKEGLRDGRAAVRMDCMSRRLELERQCF